MRAAGISPHVGECDFLGGTLLQQETPVGVEQKHGKGAVQETLVDIYHPMA
jgi:hypothetical protein